MLDIDKKKECTHRGEDYAHDSEVCESGRCMRCNDGEWEETDEWSCC
jgi:hypothetical protein